MKDASEKGPIGTHFAACDDCGSEGDHICPVCHPECEAAFKPIEKAPEPPKDLPKVGQDFPLSDDLDHIEISLTGPWGPEDMKALVEGFQAAAEAAKADGLGMQFVAVRRIKRKHLTLPKDPRLLAFPSKVINVHGN